MELNLKYFHQKKGEETIDEYFNKVIENGQKVFTTYYNNNKGKRIHIELNGKLIRHKNRDAILHISRDITKRQKKEKERLNLIIKVEEKERKRFAKDLHDGLGATLSAVKMYMHIVSRSEPGSERAKNMLNEAIMLVEKASINAKEIAVNIRPHDLAHFGLAISIQNFCNRLNSIGTIKVNLDAKNFNIKLKENIELNIFRTINELINNTLKYAEAKNIYITLLEKNKNIIIKYSDDGKGFEYNKVMNSNKSGTGLDNIIYRAKLLGGYAKISSEPGKGINVEISIEV